LGFFPGPAQEEPGIDLFFQAAAQDKRTAKQALDRISAGWKDSYSGLIIDLARFMRPQHSTHPTAKIRKRLIRFLKRQTGKNFGDDLGRWRQWLWSLPYSPHKDIFYFKAKLYSPVDAKMSLFFKPGSRSVIRLDEVDWGGVKVNGIPPLDHPPVLPAAEARYLSNRDVVFGLYINGKARAYPKRIIAWHEMVLDRVGGKDITLAYCTLCGAAIPYNSECGGKKHRFGTSGLLYRSNKLMFDRETYSLWSALTGEPVIGPLVGKGLKLEVFPLVTTTWGEWKKDHPDTTVLSLQTGFTRDYSEGVAYKDYFETDRLMFKVPKTDKRLKNKAVVLVMVLAGESDKQTALAIDTRFLKKRPLFHLAAGGKHLLVITSNAGANRVYDTGDTRFEKLLNDHRIVDKKGRVWEIKEPYLQLIDNPAAQLSRLPAHLAFWFGWYAQSPGTILVK
jgi:hypothetical protein